MADKTFSGLWYFLSQTSCHHYSFISEHLLGSLPSGKNLSEFWNFYFYVISVFYPQIITIFLIFFGLPSDCICRPWFLLVTVWAFMACWDSGRSCTLFYHSASLLQCRLQKHMSTIDLLNFAKWIHVLYFWIHYLPHLLSCSCFTDLTLNSCWTFGDLLLPTHLGGRFSCHVSFKILFNIFLLIWLLSFFFKPF